MRGLQIINGLVINIAVFDEIPAGWIEAPDDVGIGWTDNGDGTFSIPEAQSVPLDALKDQRRDKLRESCRAAITTIFQSSALGAQYSYDCRVEDQSNIKMRLAASQSDLVSRKIWAHDGVEFTRKPHTTAQLEQVNIDMEAHIEAQQSQLESLIASVNAAADADAVAAVVWV